MIVRCANCKQWIWKRKSWPLKTGEHYCVGCITELNRQMIWDCISEIETLKKDLQKILKHESLENNEEKT